MKKKKGKMNKKYGGVFVGVSMTSFLQIYCKGYF